MLSQATTNILGELLYDATGHPNHLLDWELLLKKPHRLPIVAVEMRL
jgi:hypothetical protein